MAYNLDGLPASDILMLYSVGYFENPAARAECLNAVNSRILHYRDSIIEWEDAYAELQQVVYQETPIPPPSDVEIPQVQQAEATEHVHPTLDLGWMTVIQLLCLFGEGFFNTLDSLSQCFKAVTHRIEACGDDVTSCIDLYHQLRQRVLGGVSGGEEGQCGSGSGDTRDMGGESRVVYPEERQLRYIEKHGEAEVMIKRFNLTSRRLSFTMKPVDDTVKEDPLTWLNNAVQELLDTTLADCHPNDLVGLRITNECYPDRPMGLSFRRMDQLTASVVLDVAARILQSNANFFTRDMLTLQLDRVRLPNGKGRNKMTGLSADVFCAKKRGILVVENTDSYCLAYAICLAKAYVDKDPFFQSLRISQSVGLLVERVSELCRNAKVDLSQGGDYTHLQSFQNYLKEYTIVVYNNRKGNSVYFEGLRDKNKPCLNLLLENDHYNVILSLTAAFTTRYFCDLCKHRSSAKIEHADCPYTCPRCHSSPPCNMSNTELHCKSCNRSFRGEECFNTHKVQTCNILHRCRTCHQSIWLNTKIKHKCGYKRCTTCMKDMPIRHLCHMQPVVKNTKKNGEKPFLFIFYDLETRQERKVSENSFLHEVNLCISQQACSSCISSDDVNVECQVCGQRQFIFNSSDPVADFLDHVANMATKTFKVTAIAHNMRGFDGCFVVKKLFSDLSRWNPKMIRNGLKINSICCDGNIRFIDSLNFLPMPLAQLPATFKFDDVVKGYFPHYFNTEINKAYVGPLPDIESYSPDTMSVDNQRKFLSWYNEQVQNNVIFDMATEIVKYCTADVTILRKACLKFRQCFIDLNGVDPLREATTIASACNLVFRRNFLRKDTIGIIPHGGYRMGDKQSAIAIKWLLWLEHSHDLVIEHAGRGREVRLRQGYLVDGFCSTTNTVYQFHGCYYHGCEKCYHNQTEQLSSDTKTKDMMFSRREKTQASDNHIKSLGYNLVTMWECDFNKFLQSNPDAKRFCDSHDIIKSEPLDPRASFFGGRTNACKLFHECQNKDDDETIHYFDVCSLYPYVNKYGKYPLGHPKIHIGHNDCQKLSMDSVEGLIKCTVLPPHDLYHPVLPYKAGGKLTFPLCRTCVETSQQHECSHDVNARKFTGTFVADELRKAVSLNYEILEFHEIWEYKIEVYDKANKKGGLFAGYIDNFLKIKQESSGWPSWCTTDTLKDRYVDLFSDLVREGIVLSKDDIAYNAGMRFLAKLMLNSFWGKFGQRENLMQTSIINTPMQLFEHLTNPSKIVHNLTVINEDVLVITWDRMDESVIPLKTVNCAIASYTTAQARLVLYSYLEKLGRRVLYFDTDSVIFTQKAGEWMPPVGDFLGDLTDEITDKYGDHSKITSFVSGGPKNYGYVVRCPDGKQITVCKVKGITLNYKNSQSVNFDTLKKMVTENLSKIFIHNDRRIVRTNQFDVSSRPESKMYRVHYTKRRRLPDSYDTLPYGYRSS